MTSISYDNPKKEESKPEFNSVRKYFRKLPPIIWVAIICVLIIASGIYYYENISTTPIEKSFNKAFDYYLTGDCDKYSESYFIDIPQNYGGDVGDVTYEQQMQIADNCKSDSQSPSILNVAIVRISRAPFSDTAFIEAKLTTVNDNGVHHQVPQSYMMKKIYGSWMIDRYYDPNKN